MLSVEQIVADPTIRLLMVDERLRAGETLDFELAARVKELLPRDDFSASQYLLGLGYFRRRLETIFEPGSCFLDVGCGAGVWSVAASFTQRLVVGIDADLPRLRCARTIAGELPGNAPPGFMQCRLPCVPLRDASVDAILCHNVLQVLATSHLGTLRSLRRVARKGARLHIWVHDIGYLSLLRDRAIRSRRMREALSWLRSELNARLFRLGFKIQPRGWMPGWYLQDISERASWRALDSRTTSGLTDPGQRPIFPPAYRGLPLGSDYFFEAI
jgi:SAM-dependent methyltransferase